MSMRRNAMTQTDLLEIREKPDTLISANISVLKGAGEALSTLPVIFNGETGLYPSTQLHVTLPFGGGKLPARSADMEGSDDEDDAADDTGLQIIEHLVKAAQASRHVSVTTCSALGSSGLLAVTELKGSVVHFGIGRPGLNRAFHVALGSDLARSRLPFDSVMARLRSAHLSLAGRLHVPSRDVTASLVGGRLRTPYGHVCAAIDGQYGERRTALHGRVSLLVDHAELTPYVEYTRLEHHEHHSRTAIEDVLALPLPAHRHEFAVGVRTALQRPVLGRYTLLAFQLGSLHTRVERPRPDALSPLVSSADVAVPRLRPVLAAAAAHQLGERLLLRAALSLTGMAMSLLWMPYKHVGVSVGVVATKQVPLPQLDLRLVILD